MNWRRILQFRYVFCLSVFLAGLFLYRQNAFIPVSVQNHVHLGVSVLLLSAGLLMLAWLWGHMLRTSGMPLSYAESFNCIHLNAMAKYVPGKVLLLHGITAYLYDRRRLSRMRVGSLFVLYNLLYISTGILMGSCLLPRLAPNRSVWYLVAAVLLFFALLLINPLLKLGLRLYNRIRGREPGQEQVPVRVSLVSALAMFAVWLFWGVGALLLIMSLTDRAVPWSVAFAFPLSVALGNLIFLAPGGLGVRESLLAFWLLQEGFPSDFAITISAVSRLWFLAGETLALMLALLMERYLSRQPGSDEDLEANGASPENRMSDP